MKLAVVVLGLLFVGGLCSGSQAHDFHVSHLTINVNTERQQLELTLDSFVDDLELVLGELGEQSRIAGFDARTINLVSTDEHPQADSLLGAFVLDALQLRCGDQSLALNYLGKEAAEDPYAVYVYLVAPLQCAADDAEVLLQHDFLHELYDDQQNIVRWQRDGKAVGYDLLTRNRRQSRQAL